MLIRTHLAIVVFFIILFLPHINDKIVFILVALVATMLVDIDSAFSTLGSNKGLRFLQFFVEHRGPMHSLTICVLVSVLLAFFVPVISFGFFLGYSIHLFVDSFTKEGIVPFWPYSAKSTWRLKTGSILESSIFLIFLLADVFMVIFIFL
jgi:membrane-bound metal-dependent hydrolase YbcI (DUF457 family)